MKVSEVLDGAADYIEEHGWVQGRFRTESGNVCALTAISRASLRDGHTCGNSRAASDALRGWIREREGVGCVIPWNDEDDRTEDEVIEALRKCAAEQRWTEDA